MLLSIFSIAYMDLRRKSKTVPMLCQYCGVFSLLAVTASYRQVKLLRRLDVLLLLSSRILRFCAQNISGRFLKQIVSKLNHAQIEMYFRSDFCNYTQFSLLNTVLYLTLIAYGQVIFLSVLPANIQLTAKTPSRSPRYPAPYIPTAPN